MGPGIFTKYSKQVIGGLITLFVVIAAVLLYFQFRGPVGSKSPYETVNDLYEWEYMTFASEQNVYSVDVKTVSLYFRNDSPDGVVCLSADGYSFAYALEFWKDGAWHQIHTRTDYPRWNGKTDIVNWNGGEVTLSCEVAKDYPTPLETGRYRIVLPECEHLKRQHAALAAEFEVK